MKLRCVLSCIVLAAFLCTPFLVGESFADKPELDEITNVIKPLSSVISNFLLYFVYPLWGIGFLCYDLSMELNALAGKLS